MTKHCFSYLALGDSYTVGEGVSLFENFPYQAVQMLRGKGLHFHAPEIVAKTGWTTSELAEHILHSKLNEQYDFVSLLAGVNNQYRGLNIDDYAADFEFLLRKAIHLAGENPQHVIVLSIPDWGITPFAKSKNPQKISQEIAGFNAVNSKLSEQYETQYVDITGSSRSAGKDDERLVADKLHYSALEYAQWARLIAGIMQECAGRK
ncbi:SGNH/GDSL hydrolase family protein [Foetidibacter luteolus]|uniref:SGNH/GDSL hydrolase family protein n=1 Tax=Foetidibacter luteolus TaxID=2608880 RepID=UPI00129ABF90|nr:SGNH/GDSL hydrolase family protein [Foetidibacter luteolus]